MFESEMSLGSTPSLFQFLADTFNALFAIMEENADTVGDLVFEALVRSCICGCVHMTCMFVLGWQWVSLG